MSHVCRETLLARYQGSLGPGRSMLGNPRRRGALPALYKVRAMLLFTQVMVIEINITFLII